MATKNVSRSGTSNELEKTDKKCLTIVIPEWMTQRYNFDKPANISIGCKKEGILIRRLEVIP